MPFEPPTPQLLQTLTELGVATPADLRRCRRHVRRVARDLPAFDSVWIDALVRAGKLTPFQGRTLESTDPGRLGVGPCILVDRLGAGDRSETYLAHQRESRQRCVLKLIGCPPESRDASLAALRQLVAKTRQASHPSWVAPRAALYHDSRLVTVSRYVPGLHLGEMLVRRGRFAPQHVMEIARQLIDGLSVLEACGCVHGEIALWNVRLTPAGRAVLVDAGISPAVDPELTIHAGRAPQRYDYVAPELVGTGRRPDSASDLYALGCLLWHLLAGRPPYPTADPLGKLAAHRTGRIDDVRQWAPDTPGVLAEAIAAFTASQAGERPASFREAREQIGPPSRLSRRRLVRFQASFHSAASRLPRSRAASGAVRWPIVLTVLFLLSGLALALADRDALTDPLNVPRRVSDYVENALGRFGPAARQTDPEALTPTDHDNRLPLPAPNAQGEIVLDSAGPYAWQRVDAVGPLTIRGRTGLTPVVEVSDSPCRILAETVTVENVHFRWRPRSDVSAQRPPNALLLVESQDLMIRRCSFSETYRPDDDRDALDGAQRPVAVAWKMIDPQDPSGGRLWVENTVFCTSGAGVALGTSPQVLRCVNTLKIGGGPLLVLSNLAQAGRALQIRLDRLTLRRSEALLEIHLPRLAAALSGPLSVEATGCVFDVAGSDPALYRFVASEQSGSLPPVEMTGEGSIAPPGLLLAVQVDSSTGAVSPADPATVSVEGIASGVFRFAGPLSGRLADSEVTTFQGPRIVSGDNAAPGIEARLLVVPEGTAPPRRRRKR